MVIGTPLGTRLIGSRVIDAHGHRVGRVIAVIHRSAGADVLVERRAWLRRSVQRFGLETITVLDDNRVLVGAAPRPNFAAATEMLGAKPQR